MPETYRIKIEKMVFGGDGLGRLPDGRAVFVPFVLPEEIVRVEIREDKKRFAKGWPVEILEPSPDRIQPLCIHFGECGGCQYQHLNYSKQLSLKEAILKDQFQRIGKIEEPPILPIHPSPSPTNYRNFVQFHLGQQGELGYVHVDGEHLLIIEECHLPKPDINVLWPQLELNPESGIYRLGIRQDSYDNLMLILEGDEAKPPEFSEDIPVSAVYTPPDANLTVLAGDDYLVFDVLNRHFKVSARSFFQVNTPIAEAMVHYLLDNLQLNPNTRALELYAGVGLFSAFLSPRVYQLTAIESSGSACHDFSVNLDAFENVVLYEANAEDILSSLQLQIDILIADPPRAGLAPEVHDAINHLNPDQIAYISCDPATLARDARKIIHKGYQLTSVQPFDQFPQTSHIETISIFDKKRSENPLSELM
jgi:23S rRNA (uracil1939-C5)-methyltransferase